MTRSGSGTLGSLLPSSLAAMGGRTSGSWRFQYDRSLESWSPRRSQYDVTAEAGVTMKSSVSASRDAVSIGKRSTTSVSLSMYILAGTGVLRSSAFPANVANTAAGAPSSISVSFVATQVGRSPSMREVILAVQSFKSSRSRSVCAMSTTSLG
ncbi:hypothetical protein FPV67DRAFT_1477114 [Lyophyllum atratum]|nr:hypothetical protein FPV67DRAFT_1477114 [Lyophyllum atratum]